MEKLAKPYSILIIDDEAGVLKALQLVLGAMGCNVWAFNDSTEGAEFIRSEEFAGAPNRIILCDLKMPELDGFGVLQSIPETLLSEIPFILISAHASDDEVERAKSLGARGFLPKPFGPEELRRELLRLNV